MTSKTLTKIKNRVLTLVLTIAALAVGQSVWAENYTISTYLLPANAGSISISGNITSAEANTTINFTVTPYSGYIVDKVKVINMYHMKEITDLQETAAIGQGTARSFTFNMPAGDVRIQATFTTVTLNVQTAVTPSGAGTVSYNATTHQVTATPNEGYIFKHWNFSDGITGANNISTANPYTVNQSGTYTAVFEVNNIEGDHSCDYVDENGVKRTVKAFIFDDNVLKSGSDNIGVAGQTMWFSDVSIDAGQTLNLYGNIRIISLVIKGGGTLIVHEGSLTVYGQGYGTQPNVITGNITNFNGTMTINGSSFCLLGRIDNNGTFNVNNAQFMIDSGASFTGGTCNVNLNNGGYFIKNGTFAPDGFLDSGSSGEGAYYRDGKWNTLCLPFVVGDESAGDGHHLDYTPFEGATLMELDTETAYNGHKTGISDGTLYLNFKPATIIEAGKPYIVKWSGNETDKYIINHIYRGGTPTDVEFPGGKFCGTYLQREFNQTDKSVLLLGADNTLYYPQPSPDPNDPSVTLYPSINPFHAYFQLDDGITVDDVTNSRMNFEGEDDVTGIQTTDYANYTDSDAWYTINGVKLSGKPTAKGLYIYKGKKIVINK